MRRKALNMLRKVTAELGSMCFQNDKNSRTQECTFTSTFSFCMVQAKKLQFCPLFFSFFAFKAKGQMRKRRTKGRLYIRAAETETCWLPSQSTRLGPSCRIPGGISSGAPAAALWFPGQSQPELRARRKRELSFAFPTCLSSPPVTHLRYTLFIPRSGNRNFSYF